MIIKTQDLIMKHPEKYVVLEHLTLPDRGFRFWTNNSDNNTNSAMGELWYKEVLFTDSDEEAISASRQTNTDVVATFNELMEHHRTKKD